MEFRITYSEISTLIEQKSGKRLPLVYGGPHTVRVSYDVMMTSVGINLTVESITGSDIILQYDGGMGIDFMVKQALKMAKSRPGGEFVEPLDGSRILLALGRNPQASTLFDHVTLNDIRFDEQYAIIDFTPKSL